MVRKVTTCASCAHLFSLLTPPCSCTTVVTALQLEFSRCSQPQGEADVTQDVLGWTMTG
jgi:hypothetical protein